MNPIDQVGFLPKELSVRYQVVRVIGEGGSGKVVWARDLRRGLEVALKIVGPTEASWLRREFDTLRKIRHVNLIQVFDWAMLSTGNAFYTMELIEGGDLTGRLGEPNSHEWVRSLLVRVLRALGHLHSHGELHGDLKPGNVLLGHGGVVKVSDVGMGASVHGAPSASGTPGYTAPEVWKNQPLTPQSDIYSLGVIAYEALTGVHPFQASTVREVVAGQVDGWVPSPGVHGIFLPQDIERSVMRALERDPTLRYGSADEFIEALGEADTVGEILGGVFVDRSSEKKQVVDFALSTKSASPTLLYLSGPTGSGKSALLASVVLEMGESQVITGELREPVRDLLLLTQQEENVATQSTLNVSTLAAGLLARFGHRNLLTFEDPPATGSFVRNLARYVWAEATEREAAATVRFIKIVASPPETLEQFEASLTLTGFDANAAWALVEGLLGGVPHNPVFSKRLVSEVGGAPEALESAVIELVARRLIERRFGKWQIHDLSDADWRSLRTTSSRWLRSWHRLDSEEQDILTAIGMVRSGLDCQQLRRVFGDIDVRAIVARLQAYGWVESLSAGLRPSSRESVRVALSRENQPRQHKVRDLLLHRLEGELQRADRAALLLDGEPNRLAVKEGLWFGAQLQEGGESGEALRVLARTLVFARTIGDAAAARSAGLLAAEISQRLGGFKDVLSLLDGDEWNDSQADPRSRASRGMLRGVSLKALRQLDMAREAFAGCSSDAQRSGNTRQYLQAEAELVEIDWRYGGEAGRESAAKRIDELKANSEVTDECRNEWAALEYNLGASLVTAGRREEARTILEGALERANSGYWKMRIGNALGAAHYYLGNFRAALAASEISWRYAAEGGDDSFKPRLLASMAGIRFGLGMFREAAEQDEMAAFWGRRIGSPFEYEAGLLAAMSDFISLAAFERALGAGAEVRRVADKKNPSRHVAKSLEMEALALAHLGEYGAAERCIETADSILVGRGFDELVPRLRWHSGKIHMERGDFASAESSLSEALHSVRRTRDWEDLPGVEVEMQLLFARAGDKRLDVKEVRSLVQRARDREMAIVQLRATLALAEIVAVDPDIAFETLPDLMDGLRLAERSGAREFIWRLSFWIAQIFRSSGDQRSAAARIATGVRVLREVTSELNPGHQSSYLATAHARLLLSETRLVRDSSRGQPG